MDSHPRPHTWDFWSGILPPSRAEMDELQFIVMGTEHGRCHPQPTWSFVDMPLWMLHPNWITHESRRPRETFFAKAIRMYLEATEHASTDKVYLAGLHDG